MSFRGSIQLASDYEGTPGFQIVINPQPLFHVKLSSVVEKTPCFRLILLCSRLGSASQLPARRSPIPCLTFQDVFAVSPEIHKVINLCGYVKCPFCAPEPWDDAYSPYNIPGRQLLFPDLTIKKYRLRRTDKKAVFFTFLSFSYLYVINM
jgi:hypothetical protein